MLVVVKENGWKYTADEKVIIVVNGMQNVVTQIANEYNISKTTFYRWKNRFLIEQETSLEKKIKVLRHYGRKKRKI